MRDISNKVDNVDVLSAAEFNKSIMEELENAVTDSGITLDPSGGPDTDSEMLSQAVTRAAQGAQSYQDSGVADAYVLTAIGGYKQPSAYVDGMAVTFQVGNTNTGASTVNISGLGVKDIVDGAGVALTADSLVQNNYVSIQYDLGNDRFTVTGYGDAQSSGAVKQVVTNSNASVITTTNIIPYDDTIPQITEGVEVVTATITPTSATSTLLIMAHVPVNNSSSQDRGTIALFQDATSDALEASFIDFTDNNIGLTANLMYSGVSGTTSATTFRIRVGNDATSTVTVNGQGGTRRYGGVSNARIEILEVEA